MVNGMDNTENYAIRSAVINKAINYIFDHIDKEITVDDVAHYCSYSRYHLTRMIQRSQMKIIVCMTCVRRFLQSNCY